MDVDDAEEWEVPKVESEDEFELCRAIKDKGRWSGKFERMEGRTTVKSSLSNWETVFVQFKDMEKGEWYIILLRYRRVVIIYFPSFASACPPDGSMHHTMIGIFHPVKVSIPSLLEDDEDEQPPQPEPQPAEEEMSAVRKGKRKARPDSPTSDVLDD